MIKLYKIRIGEKVYEVEVEEVTEKDGNIETSADSKDKQKIDKNENPPDLEEGKLLRLLTEAVTIGVLDRLNEQPRPWEKAE